MESIATIEFFAAVVEEGSFTGAAEELGVSKSHVSNQIANLEDQLGIRLFHRTTRSVDPTPEGEAYYERIRYVLDELEEANRAVRQSATEPRGTLRLTAPVSVGTEYFGKIVSAFVQRHEHLSVEVDLTDRKTDLVEEGYDLAVRVGALEDSSLIVRKVAAVDWHVCASPEYLERHGTPEHPSELDDHNCLMYSYLPTDGVWEFAEPEQLQVSVSGTVEANSGRLLADVAAGGVGIFMAPAFLVADGIRSGDLRCILRDWSSRPGAVWALYPHRRHLSAKVRAFIDFLDEQLSPPPWSDIG